MCQCVNCCGICAEECIKLEWKIKNMQTALKQKVESAVMEPGRIRFEVLRELNVCHFVLHGVGLVKEKKQSIYRIREGVGDEEG